MAIPILSSAISLPEDDEVQDGDSDSDSEEGQRWQDYWSRWAIVGRT